MANRAYVTLDEVIPRKSQSWNDFEAEGRFINTGNTPAFNILVYSQLLVRQNEPAEIGAIIDSTSGAMIGINGRLKIRRRSNRELTMQEIQQIENRTSFIFYLGTLTYNDIFGESHCIEFCTGYVSDPERGINDFYHCFNNNEPCSYIENL